MKFNEDELQRDLLELIEEKEKYRLEALKYREALEKIVSFDNSRTNEYHIAKKALGKQDA